jgi:ribosomal protein S16
VTEAAGYARTAGETAEAQAYGLTPGDLCDWASFSPIEIYWALKHDVSPATARRWGRKGLSISDTVRAIALGMTTQEVTPWADAGFAPSDTVEAKETGIPLETGLAS